MSFNSIEEVVENIADESSLNAIVEKQLQDMVLEEELLKKECEELQSSCDKAATDLLQVSEELSKCLSVHPKKKLVVEHMLHETVKRCETLKTDVVEQLEQSKSFCESTSAPEDEYTMMPYEDLVIEMNTIKEENEQLKQKFDEEIHENKNAIHLDEDQLNSIEEEASKFHEYCNEIRKVQQKLMRELEEHISSQIESSPESEILHGLEEKFNEMYTTQKE